ncbi:MAG TPA: hypothetical protein VFX28_02830, partial [Methylomirabilota bacterium]|nr:hypothetical protein [Methylomirabilota bacterium]
ESLRLGLSAVGPGRAVVVLEGDVVFEPDLLRAFLGGRRATATIAAPYRPELTGTFLTAGADGTVTDWVHERVRPAGFPLQASFKSVNVTYFAPEDVARSLRPSLARCLAEDGPAAPLEFALRRAVVDDRLAIAAFDPGPHGWFEVDTPDDLRLAEAIFAARRG